MLKSLLIMHLELSVDLTQFHTFRPIGLLIEELPLPQIFALIGESDQSSYYTALPDSSIHIETARMRIGPKNNGDIIPPEVLDPIRLAQYLDAEGQLHYPDNHLRKLVQGESHGKFDCFSFAAWMSGTTREILDQLPERSSPPLPGDILFFYRGESVIHAAIHIGNNDSQLTLSKLGNYGLAVLSKGTLLEIYNCNRCEARIPVR